MSPEPLVRLAACASALGLAACAPTGRLTVRVDATGVSEAAHIVVALRSDGCAGPPVIGSTHSAARAVPSIPSWTVPVGSYGVVATAVDGTCRAFAEVCSAVTMTNTSTEIVLRPLPTGTSVLDCRAPECSSACMGVPDAPGVDALLDGSAADAPRLRDAPLDGPALDGPTLDAGTDTGDAFVPECTGEGTRCDPPAFDPCNTYECQSGRCTVVDGCRPGFQCCPGDGCYSDMAVCP